MVPNPPRAALLLLLTRAALVAGGAVEAARLESLYVRQQVAALPAAERS